MTGRYFFSVILLICVATAAAQENCPYTLVTKTGPSAMDHATVALIFGDNSSTITIRDLREHSMLCTSSFQSDKLDVFRFDGPCDHEDYCDVTLKLVGLEDNFWYVQLFQLEALFPYTSCYSRMYHANTTLDFEDDEYKFNFCNTTEAVGTEKQKLTGASLLRLVGMPSYTT